MLLDAPMFLELTTSQPLGEGDLVRLEALRADGERWSRVAKPAQRLTVAQARFSGLTNAELDEAPDLGEVLEDLLEFSGSAGAWVAPEAEIARTALQRAARGAGLPRGLGPPLVGLDELGAVVQPTVCRRGIQELAAHYGLDCSAGVLPAGPPALHGPALLQALYEKLAADLLALPLPVLAEMNWLLARTRHPLKDLLKRAETAALEGQFAESARAGKLSLAHLFKDHTEIIERLQGPGDEIEDDEPEPPLDLNEVHEFFKPGGALQASMPAYEQRPEQAEMAARVAAALKAGRHLMAEAGTGVGKSLAYLAPAVLFAKAAGRPVIVSTHTKNLQSQLFHKDLPILREALGVEFEAALLKGRPNYLCARKFMYTLQESVQELDEDERAALLPVMTWAARTEDGDVAELAAFSPEEHPELWDRLHTVGEDCMGRQCPFYHRCFVYRARGLARGADLVVCNHALVFADLNLENGSLPPHEEVVFDEAHTLEDVATEHLACEVTPRRVQRVLSRLFKAPQGSSAGKGLLPSILFQLEQAKSEFPEPLFADLREHVLLAIQAVEPAGEASEYAFDGLRAWFERRVERGEDDRPAPLHVPREPGRREPDDGGFALREPEPARPAKPRRRDDGSCVRFSAETLRGDEKELLQESKESAIAGLGRLRQALSALEEDFKEIVKRRVGRAREMQKELAAQNLFLQELISDLEFVVRADEPNYVYWMERLGKRALRAVGAPLDLAALLHGQLYERKRAVILSSATLSVRDAGAEGSGFAPLAFQSKIQNPKSKIDAPHPKSFEYLKHLLGLSLCAPGQLDELLEGSPFDYATQCRLYVPTFLPEPGGGRERGFNEALAGALAPLALAAGGRTLALFTSYESLRHNAAALRRALAPEGLEVLAQGEDGSREALLARLKSGARTVLLGTASFWEGVDVPGDALSLLVIAKLPFAVFTDPLVQGRCELLEAQGKDPFLHFSVPNAILRLRQGFGRLIRSKTDRGVVVLCDKRVLTKRYGPAFLRALPVAARKAPDPERLAAEVGEFLGAPGGGTV